MQIVIDVPLDGEPTVVDNGGLADYLIEGILQRVAQMHATMWVVPRVEEDEEDEDE